jgi:hypothetical protein
MKKLIVVALLTLTIAAPGFAREKEGGQGQNYTIRDRNYVTKGYVRDGKIYDKNYRIEGYIKDNKVYDRNYKVKGYLEPNQKQGDGHGR